MTTESNRLSRGLPGLVERLGFVVLMAIGIGTPLVFMPVALQIKLAFDSDRSEDIMTKLLYMQGLSVAAMVFGSLLFATERWRVYAGRVFLPSMALAGFFAWGLLAALTSSTPGHCFYFWLPQGLVVGAALTGPLFFTNERRCRRFLIGMVICGAIVCFLGVISSMGYRGFNHLMYGFDPREGIELGNADIYAQGGSSRSAAMSTLANPEYAGSFAGVIAAICAVMLFDWAPASKNGGKLRIVFVFLLGLALLELGFSGTRQPWIALGLAGMLRLFLRLGIPARHAAAGFSAFLLSLFFGGFAVAIPVALGLVVLALVYTGWRGRLMEAIRSSDRFNRGLLIAGPMLLAVLLVAFSTPGPWNPTGLRILQRFASLANPNDNSVTERNLMFMAASQMTWENPILGVGPGRYNNRIPDAFYKLVEHDESGAVFLARNAFGIQIADQAHNDYLQTAAELGIPGLLFLLSAMVFLLGCLYRVHTEATGWERLTAVTLMVCLVTFLGVMLTSFPLQMPSRAAFFWMTVAASLGMIAAWDFRKREMAESQS